MKSLVKSNFGTYVLQKTLAVADPSQKDMLMTKINTTLANLSDKSIKTKWDALLKGTVDYNY